jgi:hypothetical protein
MALTLAEAAKLSNDVVVQGVIETVVKESRVLDLLPFVDVAGNALTYNRENAMATAIRGRKARRPSRRSRPR